MSAGRSRAAPWTAEPWPRSPPESIPSRIPWSRKIGVSPHEVDAASSGGRPRNPGHEDLVRPDYTGASIAVIVPALLQPLPAPWMPGCVAGARAVVLLVLDGFGWRAIDAARARLPVLGSLEGGPITTVVPSTTAAALSSIASGMAPASHGMVGYRMLLGGQVLDVLRWKVPEGKPPEPSAVTLVHSAFGGRNVPTVVRA